MPEKRQMVPFDQALMNELRFGGIERENLEELVRIVAGLQKAGLGRIKVFPKGIPVPTGVQVDGILESTAISKLLTEILTKTPRLGGVVIFPYGIPWPEIFRINIDIGAPVEVGPMNEL